MSLSQVSGPSNTVYSVYAGKHVAEIVAFTFSTCLFCPSKDDVPDDVPFFLIFFFSERKKMKKPVSGLRVGVTQTEFVVL